MRPVRLEMHGFAAFRDEAVVDFTDADFFVLVGATGSGKSTVIDALTFALYGTVPRWNHRSMVMYGLAPTAIRGTVRLVFDVADARYVVARDLRRTKAGVHVRNARLERLVDPTALGGIDDATEVVDADGGVTPAVEKLLGLPYEHFCQCVVLPQGEFADFLRAKPAERRTILLRLLGAGLYTEIGQLANGRASLAGQRADLLAEQLAGLSDATEEAETAAAQQESALFELTRRVAQAVPRLRSAARELESAQQNLDRIVTERDLLAAIIIPADAAELDAAHTAAVDALRQTDAAEAAAREVDKAARNRLAAAPDRGPLDRALRDHADLARVTAQIPAAQAAARDVADSLAAAIKDAGTASTIVEKARTARDVAQMTVTELAAQVDRLAAEIVLLQAVIVPDGLDELGRRTKRMRTAVATAAQELRVATDAQTRAQLAFAAAPARGPIEESLRLVLELAEVEEVREPLRLDHAAAVEAHATAQQATTAAEESRDRARAAREHAAYIHRAAGLRSELVVGRSCPVCDRVVRVLPAPGDAPELAAAEDALRRAEDAVRRARATEAKTTAAATTLATRLSAVTERIEGLTGRLGSRPADADELRRTLRDIDALDADQRTADARVRAARAAADDAAQAASALEEEASAARIALGAARDPLVTLGAPVLRDADLPAAWSELAGWASRQIAALQGRHRAQQEARGAAERSARYAREEFAAAESAADAARQAETNATAAAERARAELDALSDRSAELTAALEDAPGVPEATEQLRRIDELTAAVRASDAVLATLREDRARAAAEAERWSDRVGRAWRRLRAARDTVIGLDAPDLPDGSVLTGWSMLTGWATAAGRARASATPAAQDAVVAATRHRDETAKHLTDEFAALGLDLGDEVGGDLADTAPAVAAAARTQATNDRRRIAERRARATALDADLAKAQEEQQVARMLGNLLRSNQFPEWLEAAALDTLVADASIRLSELSGGQFELTHRDGEFMVVDHADADSLRSVRTLSGGETFQASLALALALSTQLTSMAAAGAARLDSIFLDEGFGTLDDATLEVVAGTLENLAQGDRMVGVVTHVGALADRIPVRFRVRRDPRTSSVERESL